MGEGVQFCTDSVASASVTSRDDCHSICDRTHRMVKKIRLTEITVSTAERDSQGVEKSHISPGQGRRGSWKP
jgi:hypothetical protein